MSIKKHNTDFDDVFRTIVEKMPQLVIALINEVFKTKYQNDVEFMQLRNEHMEEEGKIVTDSIFVIGSKTYHIECQSVDDDTMALRMIEYDFAIALDTPIKDGRTFEINFPESCVLYLRNTKNTPDVLEVKVNLPGEKSFVYECKTIKLANYTSSDIFEKHLLLLLPYYIMNYESQKKAIEEDADKLNALLDEYRNIAKLMQEELLEEDKSVLYTDLSNLIIRIANHVFSDNEKVKKGVADIMGGKVLQLESERIREEKSVDIAKKMLLRHKNTYEEIAEDCGLTVDFIKQLESEMLQAH
ncbi:MAG: hypothetical protein E7272_05875 [Pseudobutyrivibrio ruminis]|uniref:PD-(D/E)XK nuclease family transposase n=1 Tax=Pseudobutyrivibrio ruminis TaxID=46206 RepID=A0A927U6V3_9FIRM|nr:hypothetical protein [Pseudobutyrivibrio ruminis]